MGGSKDKQQEESNEDMDREYDKLEDYQENIAVQLAEQEEDELEKYNNKQQNPLTTLQVDTLGDSPAQVEFAEVVPDESDNHVEGPVYYAPELSFVVENCLHKMAFTLLRFPLELVG